LPALGQVTGLHFTGEADLDDACTMIELALASAKNTHAVTAQAILGGAQQAA
jgi:hypothetical protein